MLQALFTLFVVAFVAIAALGHVLVAQALLRGQSAQKPPAPPRRTPESAETSPPRRQAA
ncbi:MAG: hypothetical protein IT538_09270 [Variibacter sp.]|nr:hypothetical protein [Variibacter sp.]